LKILPIKGQDVNRHRRVTILESGDGRHRINDGEDIIINETHHWKTLAVNRI